MNVLIIFTEVEVDESNKRFGEMMRQDLQLRTQLFVCAVCSEYNDATNLKSFAIKTNALPQTVQFDKKGIIRKVQMGQDEVIQFMACPGCQCNGDIRLRSAIANCAGL